MLNNKNDDEDASTCTCEHSQSFLNSHKAVQKGNKSELHARGVLLKKI